MTTCLLILNLLKCDICPDLNQNLRAGSGLLTINTCMQLSDPLDLRACVPANNNTSTQCWPTVYDAGPTLVQHWVDVLCLPGSGSSMSSSLPLSKINSVKSSSSRSYRCGGLIIRFGIVNIKKGRQAPATDMTDDQYDKQTKVLGLNKSQNKSRAALRESPGNP